MVSPMLKAILENTAALVDKLAPADRGPIGPLVAATLRALASATYNADRSKLLATLTALRDEGVHQIDEAELERQVADAIARRS